VQDYNSKETVLMGTTSFTTIPEAIEVIRQGGMLVVVDDPDRENEGDLVMAAEKATAEHINFMVTHARGLVCVPMSASRLAELDIPLMVRRSTDPMGTAFTVSVDAQTVTTGISAAERAETVQALVSDATRPQDLRRPGHIFPLVSREGGVLRRTGHTEAAVDLARLAGLAPAGVICEIMNDDGTMARTPQLMEFAAKHGLLMITVSDLIAYRRHTERLIERVTEADLPTKYGGFRVVGYRDTVTEETIVALVCGDVANQEDVLVRMHSGCLTGDTFGSLRCDCGEQLVAALQRIAREKMGVLVYFPEHEGRGIGLLNKLRAYALQDDGKDTVEANEALGFPADLRHYGAGAQILSDLGLSTIRLLTNNPRKIACLEGYGLQVTGRIPLEVAANPNNARYLETKRCKMGHFITTMQSVRGGRS
jgi:3,4-dihydroxy 2-butanone 4-phosphate synthase/GTP cyclohydrolase II